MDYELLTNVDIKKFMDFYFDKALNVSFIKNNNGRIVKFIIRNNHTSYDYEIGFCLSYDVIIHINYILEKRDKDNKYWLEYKNNEN